MIVANGPRFNRIRSEFNALLFGTVSLSTPSDIPVVDQGNYDDEIQEYLREKPTPCPAESNATAELDDVPPSPTESSTSIALNEASLPSEVEAEVDVPAAPPKKSCPAPTKKVTNISDDTSATPAPTTRNTRAGTRQVAPPPKQASKTTMRRTRAKDT